MKLNNSVVPLAVAFFIGVSAVGCKKGIQKVTPLPGSETGASNRVGGLDNTDPLAQGAGINADPATGGFPLPGTDFSSWDKDRTIFSEQTVYFEYDQSNVRAGELHKLETVASRMTAFPGRAIMIEGHCDERGTEGYNQALGDRRAGSVREALAKLGLDPRRITTVSYGEDKPADVAHDASAWSKNRRGEIILLTPPGGGAGAGTPPAP